MFSPLFFYNARPAAGTFGPIGGITPPGKGAFFKVFGCAALRQLPSPSTSEKAFFFVKKARPAIWQAGPFYPRRTCKKNKGKRRPKTSRPKAPSFWERAEPSSIIGSCRRLLRSIPCCRAFGQAGLWSEPRRGRRCLRCPRRQSGPGCRPCRWPFRRCRQFSP